MSLKVLNQVRNIQKVVYLFRYIKFLLLVKRLWQKLADSYTKFTSVRIVDSLSPML